MVIACTASFVYLGNTIALTALPYSTIDLTSEEIETILSVFHTLQNKFNSNFKMDFAFSLSKFSLFEDYLDYSIGPVIEIPYHDATCYLTFTQVSYRMNTASRLPTPETKEYQTWCLLPLRRDYGHILIKTETIFDKIQELLHPVEIDFQEDPEFSKRFYVLAKNEFIAKSLLTTPFRNCLKQLQEKDLWMEISVDTLLLGNKKRIEVSTALEMADLLYKISGCIN